MKHVPAEFEVHALAEYLQVAVKLWPGEGSPALLNMERGTYAGLYTIAGPYPRQPKAGYEIQPTFKAILRMSPL
jgi:hypothetical protein